jgi:hypothetical protein
MLHERGSIMQKFTADEAAAIIAESRETISRLDLHPRREERREDCPPDGPPVDLPLESRNARHIRELAERDEAWERERRRERARDDLAVDHKIAAVRSELEQLRQHVIAIAKSARTGVERIDDAINALQAKADAVDQIEKMFARLESRLDRALPRERGVAVDHLPNPLTRSVN